MDITVPSGVGEDSSEGATKTFSGPAVSLDGFTPVYIEEVAVSLTGNTDSVTDQCGYTEVRRSGTVTNWQATITGIVTDTQLPRLMAMAESDETVNLQTPALGDRGGEYVVDKETHKHTDELNNLEIPFDLDADYALEFKMTCVSPESAKKSN